MKKTTFFQFNRFFLLGTLIVGLLGPLLPKDFFQEAFSEPATFIFQLNPIEVTPFLNHTSRYWNIEQIILLMWAIPVVYKIIVFIRKLIYLHRLNQSTDIEYRGTYQLAQSPTIQAPFTFLNTIYWNKNWDLKPMEQRAILRHEMGHVVYRHSLDNMFLELLKAIFWFSPIPYLVHTGLRQIHEYQADAYSVEVLPKQTYGHVLIKQFFQGYNNQLIINFSNNHLKKRIIMMTTKRSPQYVPILTGALTLFLFCTIFLISCQEEPEIDSIVGENKTKVTQFEANDKVNAVDQMPEFPGGKINMLKFVYTNVKFPEDARAAEAEGTVVVEFIVHEDGSISNPNILKSVFPSLDEEVIKVINMMPRWEPGANNGKNVKTSYRLPVKFRLE